MFCTKLFQEWFGCSVQGYGEKAPGFGGFVYPGSGATFDTKPVQTDPAAQQPATDGDSMTNSNSLVSQIFAYTWLTCTNDCPF